MEQITNVGFQNKVVVGWRRKRTNGRLERVAFIALPFQGFKSYLNHLSCGRLFLINFIYFSYFD